GASVGAEIHAGAVPVLAGAREYLARGYRPGGTLRNVEAFRGRVDVRVDESGFILMCDAPTSGGRLVPVSPQRGPGAGKSVRDGGLFYAKIGTVTDRTGKITLVP